MSLRAYARHIVMRPGLTPARCIPFTRRCTATTCPSWSGCWRQAHTPHAPTANPDGACVCACPCANAHASTASAASAPREGACCVAGHSQPPSPSCRRSSRYPAGSTPTCRIAACNSYVQCPESCHHGPPRVSGVPQPQPRRRPVHAAAAFSMPFLPSQLVPKPLTPFANPHLLRTLRRTPLHRALYLGHVAAAARLLGAGSSLEPLDHQVGRRQRAVGSGQLGPPQAMSLATTCASSTRRCGFDIRLSALLPTYLPPAHLVANSTPCLVAGSLPFPPRYQTRTCQSCTCVRTVVSYHTTTMEAGVGTLLHTCTPLSLSSPPRPAPLWTCCPVSCSACQPKAPPPPPCSTAGAAGPTTSWEQVRCCDVHGATATGVG